MGLQKDPPLVTEGPTSLERDDHSHSLLIIRELIMSSTGSSEVGHVRVSFPGSVEASDSHVILM